MSENEAPKGKGGLNAPVTAKSGCLTVLLFIGLAVLVAKVIPDKKAPEAQPPSIPSSAIQQPLKKEELSSLPIIEAEALYKIYDANEVAADEQLKGKRLVVTGRVGTISKDMFGNPYVTIGSMLHGAQCSFPGNQQASLSSLRKGQLLSVAGTVDGKMMNVQLKDCMVVTPNQ